MESGNSVELLERARRGSSEALGELLAGCSGKLLAIIRLRMGRELRARMESRDVLQATLLKGLRHVDQLRGEGRSGLIAWLARIAENEVRDQVEAGRRLRRDLRSEAELEDAEGVAAEVRTVVSRLVLSEEQERLERALESLPADYRDVIVLRRLEELSYPEIAERLGRSPDACRMLLARAMAALTAAMEEGR